MLRLIVIKKPEQHSLYLYHIKIIGDYMISALIIEDNLITRKQLVEDIAGFDIKHIYEASTSEEAKWMLSQHIPNIIFFDINLPDSTDFTFAEKINLLYPNVGIIFITGHTDFAHKAFEIEAIDYLIKPFSQERLRECMKKVYSYLNLSIKEDNYYKNNILSVKVNNGIELLEQKDIAYISAEGKVSVIQTTGIRNKKVRTTESLKSIEVRLDSNMFIRTHRSFITNLNHIHRIEPSGQTNLIYFKSCNEIAYLSKSYMVSLYNKINYR